MLPGYEDIHALTDSPPEWWDANGVPRYAPFHPTMLGVYDKWAVLVMIRCQSCRRVFHVGEGFSAYAFTHMDWEDNDGVTQPSLPWICDGYHFGDPPAHGGCVGMTMNSVPVRILEGWEKQNFEWVRDPEVESINIVPDWA